MNEMVERALTSRLKRPRECLLKDIPRLYHKFYINFEVHWFTVYPFLRNG